MLKLLAYLLSNGTVTQKDVLSELDPAALGMPGFSDTPCVGNECSACRDECPTDAITLLSNSESDADSSNSSSDNLDSISPKSSSNDQSISHGSSSKQQHLILDRGACINCSLCIDLCPSGTIVSDRDPLTSALSREGLVLSSRAKKLNSLSLTQDNPLNRSVAARVVSTGCSACDLELGASGNPIFDLERFGVHVVASPRFADVLLVTGPVPKGMHEALLRCYDAMPEPRKVIAVGSCAISGGIHKGGYTEANGAGAIVPVDVFIPGCPPHPKSIIAGILLAMGRLPLKS